MYNILSKYVYIDWVRGDGVVQVCLLYNTASQRLSKYNIQIKLNLNRSNPFSRKNNLADHFKNDSSLSHYTQL